MLVRPLLRTLNIVMAPAIRVMNELSYARKFALISFLFILPLALNLYLLGSEIDQRVQFTGKELQGNAYLRPVRALKLAIQEDRPASEISARFATLSEVDRDLGDTLGTVKLFGVVSEMWRRATTVGPGTAEAETVRRRLLTALRGLRLHVGDTSNLILDPDLDTYYLMDATLLKLPDVDSVLGDVLRDGSRGDEGWTASARAELIRIGGQLESVSSEIEHGHVVAANNNARGSVARRLGAPVRRYVEGTHAFVDVLDAVTIDGTARAPLEEITRHATEVQAAARVLWIASVDELDDLLRVRIAGFEGKKRLVYRVAAITLALVAYLLLAFYLAVARTVKGLDIATQRLMTGDLDTPIDVAARDELGHLVRAFDGLARRLREEWTQARAETKRAVEAEARVREGEARNHLILESALDAVVTLNSAGQVTWWNGRAEKLFGWTLADALGKPIDDVIVRQRSPDSPSHGPAQTLIMGGQAFNQRVETAARRSDGQEFPIELSIAKAQPGSDCAFTVFVHDIAKRKKLELELRQAQKLESVGRLAAGVAHEINTPVQFVNDNLHFLRDAVTDLALVLTKYRALHQTVVDARPSLDAAAEVTQAEQDADLDYLVENMPSAVDRSIEGLSRVATIVRSMKEFAHPDQKEMSPVDLNQAIQSTLVIARNEYRYIADVETDFGTLPPVVCHGGEINQAMLNIIVNAAHAIGDAVAGTDRRGRIGIQTRHDDAAVVIRISDTGGGIPGDLRERIFDPFFTTKDVGKGTGQGLAIARAVILDQHGGDITFETEPGVGTVFIISLPIDGRRQPADEAAA
ncbi:MAG TPA: ATP-binding protein [Vicinamibacterales bacterium]|nr:ATP-binding protein [Vicinamibacterales bacterium]